MNKSEPPPRSHFFNQWSSFRNKLSGFFSILKVVRFSLAMVLLPAIAMIFIEQGREALRILATAQSQPTPQVIWFIVSLIILTFMAWYWATILVDVLQPGAREEGSLKGWAAKQLPRICGIIPALGLAVALIVAYEPFQEGRYPQTPAPQTSATSFDPTVPEQPAAPDPRTAVEVENSPKRFIAFAIISVAFTLPVYWIFYLRRRRLKNYYRRRREHDWQLGKSPPSDRFDSKQLPVKYLPKVSKLILGITILVWLGVLVVFAIQTGDRPITIAPAQTIGPLAITLFAAAVWIPLGSLLVFWSDTYKVPLFTILLVLAGTLSLLDVNDNHQVRRVEDTPAPKIPDLETAFNEWLKNRCDLNEQVPYPVFIVSAEGGGLRAAYFTALVLSAAQDQNPQFAHHVFAISGVSGGSVGGSVFAALSDKYVQTEAGRPCKFVNQQNMQFMTNEILKKDLLSPVLAGALYPDLIQRFLFWRVNRFDRARALEDGLGQAWRDATMRSEFFNKYSFYQLSDNFSHKSTPALFLNTTQVETGERVVISSLDLGKPDGNPDEDLSGLLGINRISRPEPPNLPLSTAAFLSSRFPAITPPGSVGYDEYKSRYVDGGYFENSGTATLMDLISALSPDKVNPPIKLIVINISTDPVDMRYRFRGLGEITGPIVTLLNTRPARGTTATSQLETLIRKLNEVRGNSAEIVRFHAYQREKRLPTGWLLSEQARKNMECQLGIAGEYWDTTCSITSHGPGSDVRLCTNDIECLQQIKTFFPRTQAQP